MRLTRPFEQPKPRNNPNQRSCVRKIKRDEHGRVVKEEYIGCSKDEILAFRDADRNMD